MWTLSSSRIVRFLLAPLLSFWVAGAGCMLGCQGMVAAATANRQSSSHSGHGGAPIVASGHACSSGGPSAEASRESHDCCKTSTTEAKPQAEGLSPGVPSMLQSGASSSGTMKECPLAGSKVAVVAKSRSGGVPAAQLIAHSYRPAQNFLEQPTPLSSTPLLPNRGHTYLRCCVFLI